MIARIFILLLLIIILPDAYIDRMLLRRKAWYNRTIRVLWWLQSIILCVYTVCLATSKNFAPDNVIWLNVYLLLLGVVVIPKLVFAICSLLGWGHCRFHHTKDSYGNAIGILLALIIIAFTLYGSTFGFNKVTVRHEDFYSEDLPEAFDGYKIVHFSDLHAGTFAGRQQLPGMIADSINAANADAVMFTGDIQNMEPKELRPYKNILSSLKSKDGVFSILGNHDYSQYIKADEKTKAANERETIMMEKSFGWNLLLNSNKTIRRGKDSIIIAGMENDGKPPYPMRGDIKKAARGVKKGAFMIMLEHDPTAWRRKILPQSGAQLTLSGHTHAMQFEVLGWSPASFIYDEWGGMYHEGKRAINVSTGAGGFIPFRIGATNEIVVITLHRKR